MPRSSNSPICVAIYRCVSLQTEKRFFLADLKLHWDGDRVMFTQTQDDKRWNIYEVNLDGTGFKPLVENDEPDLEFYDGTYLPDGRVIAISNIGYQGVPCVNGSDAVGNMVLYDPKDKSMRRLTFDQDANWNPVIMITAA